jgi:hypothetical protein
MDLKRDVVQSAPKGHDLETHVSLVEIGGEQLVEVADFIISKNEYGRGYHVPVEYSRVVAAGFEYLANKEGVT